MLQPPRPQLTERTDGQQTVLLNRLLQQLRPLVERSGVPQTVEVLLPRRRIMRTDSMRYVVQGQPLHDSRYAETVVAVEVCDAEPRDRAGRDPGVQHLPLGPLPRIEQEPVLVPAQEVSVLGAFAGGHLAAGAEDDQLPQTSTS